MRLIELAQQRAVPKHERMDWCKFVVERQSQAVILQLENEAYYDCNHAVGRKFNVSGATQPCLKADKAHCPFLCRKVRGHYKSKTAVVSNKDLSINC